jgi:hypothetical protein
MYAPRGMRTFNGLTKRKKSGTVAAQAAEAETQAESWDIHDVHMAAAASEAQHGGDETQQAAFGQASEPDAMSGGAAAAAGDDADDLGGEVVRTAKESETLRVHQVCVSDGERSQGAMMASMDVSASEMSFGQFMEKYAPFLLSLVSRLVLYRSFFICLSFSFSPPFRSDQMETSMEGAPADDGAPTAADTARLDEARAMQVALRSLSAVRAHRERSHNRVPL